MRCESFLRLRTFLIVLILLVVLPVWGVLVAVLLGLPETSIATAVNRFRVWALLGGGVVAVLALRAAWDVGDRDILRPVQALRHTTTRLATGDLRACTGLLNGCGEWLPLAHAFDQMAASLERLAQPYALLLNAAGDGIYGVDRQGTTIFVNPTAARLLGYDHAVLSGQSMHTTLHHTKADGTPFPWEECPVYQTLTTGVVHHIPYTVPRGVCQRPVVRRRHHRRGCRDVP